MPHLRYFSLSILLLIAACNKNDKPQESVNPQLFEHESYRLYLWQLLFFTSYDFDFIGTHVDSSFYPGFDGLLFDRDHEGISGIQTQGVLDNMDYVLQHIAPPDVVLLGIGGNDLATGKKPELVIENIEIIIKKLQKENPDIIVFVEQIAPIKSLFKNRILSKRIEDFNNRIPDLAIRTSDGMSQVIAVEMCQNWRQRYFADEVHYNAKGAQEVAHRYFNELYKVLDVNRKYSILPLGDSRVEGNRKASQ